MSQTNFLSPISWGFTMAKAPHLNFNVQSVKIPGLSLGIVKSPSPFVPLPLPGNITYDELAVTFKVSEDMKEYFELFDWMNGLGHPDNLDDQFDYMESDCTVIVNNYAKRPNLTCKFTSAMPTYLSGLEFDASDTDVTYFTATATFTFLRYFWNTI